ncbi:hypothetical protein VPEG_00102 [Vibrio phage SIO-2]|uniref:hypothetical protein n=1 Tax=Vibrio phage SIO-2 TaxID=700512 RepID=UPI0002357C8B|nr:hypothetical protein VPEG_00102 [Vibrio phage SIO-2]AET42252.1 hypothetical protein VPEG_00102 [Vibrio phage SIO-2]QKE60700.1 neck protein [Vibrio phage vB_VhaS-VHB1]
MINFTVNTGDAVKQIASLAAEFEKELDPEQILDDAASAIFSRTVRRFRAKQTPDGVAWKESEAAQIRKAGGFTYSNGRKVTGGDTLFATGTLFRKLELVDDGAGQRRIINDAPYAYYLNYYWGGQWQFLGAGEQDVQVFLNIVNDRIKKVLGS